jgi:hypothetical protein
MDFEYPHGLPKDDARQRLEALGEYLGNRHGIHVNWSGDTGSFNGKYLVVNIQGELTLGDGKVLVSGRDPGMLWRRKATSYLQKKLAKYLDAGVPVDALPRG